MADDIEDPEDTGDDDSAEAEKPEQYDKPKRPAGIPNTPFTPGQTAPSPGTYPEPEEETTSPAPDYSDRPAPRYEGPGGQLTTIPVAGTPLTKSESAARLQAQNAALFSSLPPEAQKALVVNQLALSQAETMRLQRMQNAIGEVQSNPGLSQEEKDDAVFQLKTGINPLLVRQAKANALRTEQQNKLLDQQIIQATAHEATRAQLATKTDLQRTTFLPDGTGIHTGLDGHVTIIKPQKDDEAKIEATKEAMRLKREEASQKAELAFQEKDEDRFDKVRAAKEKDIDKKIAEFDAVLPGQRNASTPGINIEYEKKRLGVDDPREYLIQQAMKAHMGHPTSQQYIESMKARRAAGIVDKKSDEIIPKGKEGKSQEVAPTVAPVAKPAVQAVTEAKPFTVDMKNAGAQSDHPFDSISKEKLSPEQGALVDALKQYRDKIAATNFPKVPAEREFAGPTPRGGVSWRTVKPARDLKQEHLQDADNMLEALARYGSPANMQKEDPPQYERWNKQLEYWRRLFPKKG